MKRRTPLRAKKPMQRSPMRRKPPAERTVIPPAVRKAVLRRDEGCRARAVMDHHECWGGLVLHHVLPRSRGGAHTAENLVTLCSLAHMYVHSHPAWAKPLGLLR
jgi:5-methylcytosine-specific restriction endonuclease McrA